MTYIQNIIYNNNNMGHIKFSIAVNIYSYTDSDVLAILH